MMNITAKEHDEQGSLFQWAGIAVFKYPELNCMFAIPNGGLRNPVVARKLKAEGVKSGVSDIFLSVARGGYHGLYIEMKRIRTLKLGKLAKKMGETYEA